jgi:hypothetical protein
MLIRKLEVFGLLNFGGDTFDTTINFENVLAADDS